MLENNAVLSFKSMNEFIEIMNEFKIPKKWKMQKGILNSRGFEIKDKEYVILLKDLFQKSKLFRRNVSIAEIVSWLDSFVVIKRLLSLMEEQEEVFKDFEFYFEYKIEMSKNRRIDYIIRNHDKLLLIEFRSTEKFDNISSVWQKKELELLIYKELLCNYLPEEIKVRIYSFVMMPEYSDSTRIEKNAKYNNDNIKYLLEFIKKYLM